MRFRHFLPALLIFTAFTVPGARADTIRVAAAANLQRVLTESLLPAFTQKTGTKVIATYGSTKVLAAQIENGAPFDVFMAADTETVDHLVQSKLIAPGSVRVYAVGRLVVWASRDVPHRPLRMDGLADPMFKRIAIANPKLAPYGQAALQAIERAGLSAQVLPRVVYAENIAQALQYAKSGNAEIAFTALSLVIDDKVNPYFLVPQNLYSPLRQAVGIVKLSNKPMAARSFVDYLNSAAITPVWKRYGYQIPVANTPIVKASHRNPRQPGSPMPKNPRLQRGAPAVRQAR